MALYTGGFGSGQRLLARDFLVLGLITFWIYTAVRFARDWFLRYLVPASQPA
jgi:hypothetical protein